MPRKGEIREWFSKILYSSEDPNDFSIIFRDFDNYIEIPFMQFLERQKENSIPFHRISQIKKHGKPVYTRAFFCKRCGKPLKNH